jgi:RNA-binding protein PNO1
MKAVDDYVEDADMQMDDDDDDVRMSRDTSAQGAAMSGIGMVKPNFPAISATDMQGGKIEYRKIRCPQHRLTPLRSQWENIMSPIVEYLKLQIRFNPSNRCVELKTSELTEDPGAIQKGQDFIEAFMMGFELQDAVALLRLDDLFIDSFMVTDVKMLSGDHLSRAIGRIVGQDGKTKYAIENATRTRIVMADQKIHIMGSFTNIQLAKDALCNLIIGAPPGKVYNQMRNVSKRLNERF